MNRSGVNKNEYYLMANDEFKPIELLNLLEEIGANQYIAEMINNFDSKNLSIFYQYNQIRYNEIDRYELSNRRGTFNTKKH